jgi:hypothetical protein
MGSRACVGSCRLLSVVLGIEVGVGVPPAVLSDRAAVSLRGCKRDRSASHLTDIPDHQDQVVGHPEVDRWCPLIEGDRQFGEDGVA